MKEITSYNRAVQYMGKVFKMVNEEYFGNGLEMPTITIQSTVGAYGHVTTSKGLENRCRKCQLRAKYRRRLPQQTN